MEQTKPLFEIGEIAILQPPHYSAKAYWGIGNKNSHGTALINI